MYLIYSWKLQVSVHALFNSYRKEGAWDIKSWTTVIRVVFSRILCTSGDRQVHIFFKEYDNIYKN